MDHQKGSAEKMILPDDVYKSPNSLAQFYSRFKVSEKYLFTGHSHQAWLDCGFEGQKQAWLDAAKLVDEKWERAFKKAEEVKKGFTNLLDDENGCIALGQNTHELIVRFISALPLKSRSKLITTDGEFHTIRRQLDRLAEEGIDIVKVPSQNISEIPQKIIEKIDDKTSAVLMSKVFFKTGEISPPLTEIMQTCLKHGAELLVDVYHALNVVPFSIKKEKLDAAFIVGGGYKYCQLGEGNCFLRFPQDCSMRPVVTGWYSEFGALSSKNKEGKVNYGNGSERFAGATYDPTSNYRAAEVFKFFQENKLDPEILREISQHQISLIASLFDESDPDKKIISRKQNVPMSNIGGFMVLNSPKAGLISKLLRDRGILTDFRGESLRIGPAPYISDNQIKEAMNILTEVIHFFNN
jgi:kynureninase